MVTHEVTYCCVVHNIHETTPRDDFAQVVSTYLTYRIKIHTVGDTENTATEMSKNSTISASWYRNSFSFAGFSNSRFSKSAFKSSQQNRHLPRRDNGDFDLNFSLIGVAYQQETNIYICTSVQVRLQLRGIFWRKLTFFTRVVSCFAFCAASVAIVILSGVTFSTQYMHSYVLTFF